MQISTFRYSHFRTENDVLLMTYYIPFNNFCERVSITFPLKNNLVAITLGQEVTVDLHRNGGLVKQNISIILWESMQLKSLKSTYIDIPIDL